jgi:hypothetical protein
MNHRVAGGRDCQRRPGDQGPGDRETRAAIDEHERVGAGGGRWRGRRELVRSMAQHSTALPSLLVVSRSRVFLSQVGGSQGPEGGGHPFQVWGGQDGGKVEVLQEGQRSPGRQCGIELEKVGPGWREWEGRGRQGCMHTALCTMQTADLQTTHVVDRRANRPYRSSVALMQR